MRRFLAIVALLIAGAGATAKAVDSPTASFADVQATITGAAAGSTVRIPDGAVDWGANTLTISKAITLKAINGPTGLYHKAATSWSVKITCGLALKITADNVTIDGLQFVGGSTTGAIISVSGKSKTGVGTALYNLRLTRCSIVNGKRAVNPTGLVEGVIDHNQFLNNDIAIGPYGDDYASWSRPIVPGTRNSLFIEDNDFVVDLTNTLGWGQYIMPTSPDQYVYLQQGARAVVRYNFVDWTPGWSSTTSWVGYGMDVHGNMPGGSSDLGPPDPHDAINPPTDKSIYASPIVEVYNNTLLIDHAGQFDDFRGGTILIHDNLYQYKSGGQPAPFVLKEEEVWTTGGPFTSTGRRSLTRGGYPANEQIKNTFIWSNQVQKVGSTAVNVTTARATVPNEPDFIQEGRDYWMAAPDSTNGNPAGVFASYAPFTYPHPLITEQDSSAPIITSANSTVFLSGNAGSFAITTFGNPNAAITKSGTLPSGITFVDNGNGTALISGTATGASVSSITLTATNTAGSSTQNFTLTVASSNASPTCSIVAPLAGNQGTAPLTIPITVIASDSDGSVASVTLSHDGVALATLSSPPWVYNWTGVTANTYTISAIATDNLGATSPPATVTISVAAGSTSATPSPATATFRP